MSDWYETEKREGAHVLMLVNAWIISNATHVSNMGTRMARMILLRPHTTQVLAAHIAKDLVSEAIDLVIWTAQKIEARPRTAST